MSEEITELRIRLQTLLVSKRDRAPLIHDLVEYVESAVGGSHPLYLAMRRLEAAHREEIDWVREMLDLADMAALG